MKPRAVKRIGLFFTTMLIVFGAAVQAYEAGEPIQWITEEYPPFNFSDSDGAAVGITVDLLKAMTERAGIPFDASEIQVLPWARGYRLVQEEANRCLFGTTVTESRRQLFQFIEPAVELRVGIIGPRATGLQIDSLEDLETLQIGVVRDDIGELLLQEIGAENLRLIRTDSARNLVRMLAARRFDVVSYGDAPTFWTMLKNGIDPDDYEIVWVLRDGVMGFACHPDTSPDLLEMLQESLDSLIKDGTSAAIRERYVR